MSIEISGDVRGDLENVYYIPSVTHLHDALGNLIVQQPVYALITPKDEQWHVQVSLPDNVALWSRQSQQWYWIATEVSRQGTVRYALTAEPRAITYAASRPRRAQEAR